MKILLCSDSHGDNETLESIVKKHPNCDLYIHAGDSCSMTSLMIPFECVKGNCDYFSDFQERRIFDSPLGKILVQHFPDLPKDIVNAYNIRVFIHGHTHKRRFENVNGIYIINPGSISYSRDGNEKSYAIVEITSDNLKINFYSL